MDGLKKGLAALSAAIIFAGSVGCSSIGGAVKRVSDSYINAVLAMDVAAADALSMEGNSHLGDYMSLEYKMRAVSQVLGMTHYRFEPGLSGDGEDGSVVAAYTLVMPNLNASISSNPDNFDEFVEFLNTMGKSDVTVTVVLKKIDGEWRVINSDEIASNLYGSLFYPGYEFILDGHSILLDGTWTGSNEDGSFNDVQRISCHYDFSDAFISSGVSLNLTYEYYRNDELIYSGDPVYDDDMSGVSFPLNIDDTNLNFDYLPEYNYRLQILNNGNVFYEDYRACTLSPLLFPDGTAVDDIIWQYTDRSNIYFNCSDIVAKVWLDSRYIDSGRPLDITYDIFRDGEMIYSGGEADIYDGIAVCSYGDGPLDTGSYSINVYNNGTFAGSSIASVILNLDPDDYLELEVPDNVADSNEEEGARLEIFTGSTNAIDIADDYTDVDFHSTSISMNIFTTRLDAVLASGEDAPDMIICDSDYARRYALSDMTIPVNNIGISYSELQYMYEYTFALATDADSVIKGVTWEVTPGAVFYCRSAMSSALGVSEPGEVAPLFASWDAVLDTAQAVNEASDGTRNLFSCPADVEGAYIYGRNESWFDGNGNISTPDYMNDYIPFINALTNEGLTFDCSRWSSDWTQRINNRTAIAYMGTMRFGELFLKQYHPGDWGIVMPPVNYYDGGNYIYVTSYCDMEASAARFIRNVCINEDNLYSMSEDGITVNNISVLMACADNDAYCESWLNGQNPFRVFSQVALGIDASAVSPYDDVINDAFIRTVDDYVNGGYGSPDEALEAFEEEAEEVLG